MTGAVYHDSDLLAIGHMAYRVGRQSILENVDFALQPGAIVVVIGPNGAGKTTLAKILLGLLKPTAGWIRKKEGLRSAYVPQKFVADPALPLHVESFLRLPQKRSDAIVQALENVDALHLRHVPLFHLSGGEWQKVLLARAFLRQPHFLVLDEPGQGVDSGAIKIFYEKIVEMRDAFSTGIVMVTHDLPWAFKVADRIVILNRTLLFDGRPDAAMRHESFLNMFPKSLHDA